MIKIKEKDFVILKVDVIDLAKNSVGIVQKVRENLLEVFFIGKRKLLELEEELLEYIDVLKTGKSYEYKICNVCHILKKDFEDFEINQTDAKGRKTTRPTCKVCREKIEGVNLLKSDNIRMEAIRPTHFFICPICQKASIPGVTANLVKDHDHITGKAREWICDSCNTGLGRFRDDIDTLKRAIAYLEKHSQNN